MQCLEALNLAWTLLLFSVNRQIDLILTLEQKPKNETSNAGKFAWCNVNEDSAKISDFRKDHLRRLFFKKLLEAFEVIIKKFH